MIKDNVARILAGLPSGVRLVAAAKTRSPEEVMQAIEAGVKIIGENYVQEGQQAFQAIGSRARWHFIGHLQSNKVKKAVEIFDMIETVDSFSIAKEISKRAGQAAKVMPVLIEINSGEEEQKFGVLPHTAEDLAAEIADLPNIKIQGLMTMGPFTGDPEDARPYFATTRKVFERLATAAIPGVVMQDLSMGMTNSYQVAIEEGANIVRIGTLIFGPRY